jgi:acetylornithine deacetylase
VQAKTGDPLLGPATLSVGRIEGGTSVNTVPDFCRIEIDRRLVIGERPADAPEALKKFLIEEAKIGVPFESMPPWMSKSALTPHGSEDLRQRLSAAIQSVRGAPPKIEAVPYGTDASTLADAGIPSVVFGPGDIAKAHTCDEWVPLDEVEQASEILFALARRMNE